MVRSPALTALIGLTIVIIFAALHPTAQASFSFPFNFLISGLVTAFIFLGLFAVQLGSILFTIKTALFVFLNLIWYVGVEAYFIAGFLADIPPTFQQIFLWFIFMSLGSLPVFLRLLWLLRPKQD